MHDDAPRQLDACAHEHRRPDDGMKPRDVLADDVHLARPESAERLGRLYPVNAADVVDEGIEPHIHDVRLSVHWILRARDAPVERAPADGQVAHLHPSEALEDLASVLLGLDELRMLLDVLDHSVLVLRHPEEEAGLGDFLQRRPCDWVLEVPFLSLGIRNESLFADEVPTLVFAEVDVACVPALLPHRLANGRVFIGRGPHIEVGGDIQALVQGLEAVAIAIAQGQRRHPVGLRTLGDLLPMLVGTRLKEDILAQHPMESRKRVAGQRLVGVPDVGPAVRVVNGCGDVVPAVLAALGAGQALAADPEKRAVLDRHPPLRHRHSLAVHHEGLLLPSGRSSLLRAAAAAGTAAISLRRGEAVRIPRAERRDLPVPPQNVGELMLVGQALDLREAVEVLLSRLHIAAHEGPLREEIVQLRQPPLGLEAADCQLRRARRHGRQEPARD
mmetsp:Transcript_37746/g.108927  ORF Transcript_37746/g.108927 Transcript_37746/m.108927 type:complete len:445 (+) Transcript_37746:1415-2749(+)